MACDPKPVAGDEQGTADPRGRYLHEFAAKRVSYSPEGDEHEPCSEEPSRPSSAGSTSRSYEREEAHTEGGRCGDSVNHFRYPAPRREEGHKGEGWRHGAVQQAETGDGYAEAIPPGARRRGCRTHD